ncbi:unnamed protein product [Urochloa humidicola]
MRVKEAPEKGIVIHSNDFPVLKKFVFGCKLSYLTFEPAAMPLLKELEIDFDSRAPEAEHGVSPLNGIEHLASLEELSVHVLELHPKAPQISIHEDQSSLSRV